MLLKGSIVAALAAIGTVAPAQAATFTVTNELDTGAGSLRQAVADAEATAGADVITFAGGVDFVELRSTITISTAIEMTGAERPTAPAIVRSGTGDVRLLDVTASGALTLRRMRVETGKVDGDGANIRSAGALTLVLSQVRSGTATGRGGGIFSSGGSVVVEQSLVDRSRAASGAGIATTGDLRVTRSNILNNTATGDAAGTTGGLEVDGALTLLRSAVALNQIDDAGQAASVVGAVKAARGTIGETTFVGNEGTQVDIGGTLTSSVVTGPAACTARTATGGGNVVVDASCFDGGLAPRDLVADPMVDPTPRAAGLATIIYELRPGSPAIDRAVAVAEPKVDHRGSARFDHPEFATVAGSDGTDAGMHELLDRKAPVITLTGPALTNDTTPTFTFTVDEPAEAECAVDGAAARPCTSPFTAPALPDGDHRLVVLATDPSGNRSSRSLSFRVDATPPETTLTGPSGATRDARPVLDASTDDADAEITCRLDDAVVACPDGRFQPAQPLADGRRTFTATATDEAGNADPTPASTAFVIDTRAPETSVARDGGGWTVTADEQDVTFACTLDGAPVACDARPALAPGRHRFTAVATDAVGNVDATPAVSEVDVAPQGGTQGAVVDRLAPDTRFTTRLKRTRSRRPVVRFTATERGATFECRVDKGRWRACRSPLRVAKLRLGRHAVLVRARDAAGNTDATPARLVFRVLRKR